MRLRTIVLASVLVIAAGCSGEDRPTTEAWTGVWMDAVSVVEGGTTGGELPSTEVCEATLAGVRMAAIDLKPTPDPVLDETVVSWIEAAESVFFECGPADVFTNDIAELSRLQAEIDRVLEIDSSGG